MIIIEKEPKHSKDLKCIMRKPKNIEWIRHHLKTKLEGSTLGHASLSLL